MILVISLVFAQNYGETLVPASLLIAFSVILGCQCFLIQDDAWARQMD